jgi:hypothetical protein
MSQRDVSLNRFPSALHESLSEAKPRAGEGGPHFPRFDGSGFARFQTEVILVVKFNY